MDDPSLKQKYMDKLKSLLIHSDNKPKFNKPIISLSKTLERFKNKQKRSYITRFTMWNSSN